MNQTNRSTEDRVVTCPGAEYAVTGVASSLLGLGALSSAWLAAGAADRWAAGAFGALLTVVGLLLVWYHRRAKVRASEAGIGWRLMTSSGFADWASVRDYYFQEAPRVGRVSVIETTTRRIRLGRDWSNLHRLRDCVGARAVGARALAWGLIGARPEDDWPQVFTYAGARGLGLAPSLFYVAAAYLAWTVASRAPDAVRELGWVVASLGLAIGLFLVVGFCLLATAGNRLLRVSRVRRAQRIIVDTRRIRFEDTNRTVEAEWAEVLSFRRVPGVSGGCGTMCSLVVETTHGTFDFVPLLDKSVRLAAIIKRFAARATDPQHAGETDVTGSPVPNIRQPGEVRVFTYRTVTNRLLLFIPTALSAGLWLQWGLACAGFALPGGVPLWPSLIATAATLWGWWRGLRAAVRIDSTAVTQIGLMGSTTIPWREIESYRTVGGDILTFGVVRGSGKVVWIWFGIGDWPDLKNMVQARAPKGSGAWY